GAVRTWEIGGFGERGAWGAVGRGGSRVLYERYRKTPQRKGIRIYKYNVHPIIVAVVSVRREVPCPIQKHAIATRRPAGQRPQRRITHPGGRKVPVVHRIETNVRVI